MAAPTLTDVAEHLNAQGLIEDVSVVTVASVAVDADPFDTPLPWYMRLLVAMGAWLAGAFALFWIVFGVAITLGFNDGVLVMGISAVIGLLSLLVVYALGWGPSLYFRANAERWAQEGEAAPEVGFVGTFVRTVAMDFAAQLAVAGVLAGQIGFAIGFAVAVDDDPLPWLLLAQSGLLLLTPHYVVRFTSALGGGFYAAWALADVGTEPMMAAWFVTMTAIMAAVWMTWPAAAQTRAWAALRPIGHGLATFVLIGVAFGPEALESTGGILPIGLSAVAFALAIALLSERRALAGAATMVLLLPALVAAWASWSVPGIPVSLLVIALGVRARDRVLLGGGLFAMALYSIHYWVVIDLDSIWRFGALFGLGIFFLSVWAVIRE